MAIGSICIRDQMAQVFGESGRNAAEESHKKTKKLLVVAFAGIGALGFLGGYAIGAAFPIRGFPVGLYSR